MIFGLLNKVLLPCLPRHSAALRAMDRERVVELCLSLQSRHRAMRRRTADLRSRTDQVSAAGDTVQLEVTEVTARLQASETELTLAREALAGRQMELALAPEALCSSGK